MLHNAIKKSWRKIALIGAVLGLLLAVAWSLKNPIFAADKDPLCPGCLVKYEDYDDVEDLVETYHETLNEEMNRRIELFLKAKPEELAKMEYIPPQKKETRVVDGVDTVEITRENEKCPKDATSTYCVSQKFLDEYYAFRKRMIEIRNRTIMKAQTQKEAKFEEVSRKAQEIDAMINNELAYAQKTLDLALATYNELHMAYPLHQKFTEFTAVLEKYRDAVRDIRHKVDFYPVTFFNVQTTKCT